MTEKVDKGPGEFDKVAAIIGKPGLYTLEGVSPRGFVLKPLGGSGIVFVSVTSKKVMLLKDLGIYTLEDTTPLKEVLTSIRQKEEEGVDVPDENAPSDQLFEFLKAIVPNYDQTRVKASDVKKVVKWYKILKENNLLPDPDTQNSESEEKMEEGTEQNQVDKETKSKRKRSSKSSKKSSSNSDEKTEK